MRCVIKEGAEKQMVFSLHSGPLSTKFRGLHGNIFRTHPVGGGRAYERPPIRRIHGLNATNIPKLKRVCGLANHSRNNAYNVDRGNDVIEKKKMEGGQILLRWRKLFE